MIRIVRGFIALAFVAAAGAATAEPAAPLATADTAPPLSAASMELGRQLADMSQAVEAKIVEYDRLAQQTEVLLKPEGAGATGSVVAAGIRRSARAHADEMRDAYGRAYAEVFSSDELAQIIAYETSSAGRFLRSNVSDPALAAVLARNLLLHAAYGVAEEFCRTWDCSIPVSQLTVKSDATIDQPRWSREPAPSDVAARTPPIVRFLGLSGFVRLACGLGEDGRLGPCSVAAEAPAGLGYGPAALSLASAYQLPPSEASPGATVAVRVEFPRPEQPDGLPVPQRTSEGALTLARRFAAGNGQTTDFHRGIARSYQAVLEATSGVVSPAAFERLQAAFAAAIPAASESYVRERASLIAANLSDEQIAQAVAFVESPAGRAWWTRTNLLDRKMAENLSPIEAQITREARAALRRDPSCLN